MNRFDELRNQNREGFNIIDTGANRLDTIAQESFRVADIANHAGEIISDIDKQFAEKTKLSGLDITFLFLATALQCVRQYVFANDKFRLDSTQGDKMIKSPLGKAVPKDWKSILLGKVPYDAVQRTDELSIQNVSTGISGATHRYRTLGHDPILGWIFGSVNILSDSLTKSDFVTTYSVVDSRISGLYPNGTIGAFNTAIEQVQKDKYNLPAAIAKQAIHFGSDYFTKQGLPVPFICSVNNDIAKWLTTKANIDMYSILRGASLAILINIIIACIHNLFYDESKHGTPQLYEVKTRRILSYSNIIATTSNALYVVISRDYSKADIGGLLVTISRIFSDYRFIQQIKQEFLNEEFNRLIQGDEYDFLMEDEQYGKQKL